MVSITPFVESVLGFWPHTGFQFCGSLLAFTESGLRPWSWSKSGAKNKVYGKIFLQNLKIFASKFLFYIIFLLGSVAVPHHFDADTDLDADLSIRWRSESGSASSLKWWESTATGLKSSKAPLWASAATGWVSKTSLWASTAAAYRFFMRIQIRLP